MRWHRIVDRLWYSEILPPLLRKPLNIPWEALSALAARRASSKTLRIPSVVVSVGNLVSGGTGKTPFTVWLAKELRRLGVRLAIVARSMGKVRNLTNQIQCGERLIFGDEPLLIKCSVGDIPVWVGDKKWYAALMAYIHHFPQVILIDDGSQHRRIEKDMELILFDAKDLWGNGVLLPFGPLRESPKYLARADVIVITGIEEKDLYDAERKLAKSVGTDKPFVKILRKLGKIRLAGQLFEPSLFRGMAVYAFCAIARPERFFRLLALNGFKLQGTVSFPDHYCYEDSDLLELLKRIRKHDEALLVCTEKDYYKLPPSWRGIVGSVVTDFEFITPFEVVRRHVIEPIIHLFEDRKCRFPLW